MRYSVIIPSYNCEATLEKTVESIQVCGLQDFEILLVDDGSKDGTPALCDRLAAEQGNVRVFHQPNGGVSSARNRGLSEAQGDYVWFFDSDDLVDPGSMERAAQIAEEKQPDMLIFGMSFDFYRDGKMYHRWDCVYPVEAEYAAVELENVFQELYKYNALTSSCNKLFKRSVLTDHAISYDRNLSIMEDFLLVVQTISHCKTVYTLPQVIYRYYHSDAQSGENDNAVVRVSRIPNLEEYLAPFKTALENQPETMSALYYMLLEQRLRYQKPREIKTTAQNFCDGPFSKGVYDRMCPPGSKKTADLLRKKRCFGVYLHHRFRTKAVRVLRKTPLYRVLKKLR